MNYTDRQAYTQLKGWLEKQHFTVFGTVKFTDGTLVSDRNGERTMQAYFSALDRAYFGHAVENVGMRQKRIVFKHMGVSGKNLHYHFLAKPCTDPQLYAQLARQQWAKMSSWTMGINDTQIEPVRCNKAASAYVLHEYGKLGADTICLSASSLKTPTRNPQTYRSLAQIRRLLRLQACGVNGFETGADDYDELALT